MWEPELKAGNNKEYKIKAILESAVSTYKIVRDKLLGLYYSIF